MKLLCSGRRAIAQLVHHGNAANLGSAKPTAWFRCLSSAPCSIDLNSASYILWGAGTDVGKTTIAAGLAYTAAMKKERFLYIKPVQTGFPKSCDAKTVAAHCGGGVSYGPHAQHFSSALPISNRGVVQCHTLFAWEKPSSPHLAAKADERECITDEIIINETAKTLTYATGEHGMAILETAGGVSSPFPSETLQCDALRQIRLPSILVADSKLGGISATLTAYDSLLIRGFDVVAVVLTNNPQLDNAEYISHNLRKQKHWIGGQRPIVVVLPELPKKSDDPEEDRKHFTDWLEESQAPLDEFSEELKNMYTRRCAKLRYTIYEASEALWWPFTQHKLVEKQDIAVFDSRWGDNLSVVRPLPFKQWKMQPQFDACASWWTQGLGAEMQPEMARAVAYAAGRYGHVIFPECVHDAVLQCSQKLLETVGRPWASKVFFSDNGSTAVEVAIKMGFRLFLAHNRQNIHEEDQMKILSFANSYHGDTLGAMEAAPPSAFNKNQFPWYKDQGVFITPPTLSFRKGEWIVQIPDDWPGDAVRKVPGLTRSWKVNLSQPSLSREKEFRALYSTLVDNVIDATGEEENDTHGKNHIGSLIMEPVMQGAGGMLLVDPLFQQEVVKVCQRRGIPVILDEIFTGFWRVGAITAAELLGVHPDIACFGKLFTGGYVPLSVTITGKAAFKAFWGKYKTNALLHGHSFTAHPIGCVAACTAMDIMSDPKSNPNFVTRKDQEEQQTQNVDPGPRPSRIPYLQQKPKSGSLSPLWDDDLVTELSNHGRLQGVVAIGTVFAATLKPDKEEVTGYRSNRAKEVTRRLRLRGVFARPLGDVVYLLAGVTTPKSVCTRLLTILKQELDVPAKG